MYEVNAEHYLEELKWYIVENKENRYSTITADELIRLFEDVRESEGK